MSAPPIRQPKEISQRSNKLASKALNKKSNKHLIIYKLFYVYLQQSFSCPIPDNILIGCYNVNYNLPDIILYHNV